VDVLNGPFSLDVDDLVAVVGDQRCGLIAVDIETGADGLLVVVGATTGEHALDDDVLGDLVVDDTVEWVAGLVEEVSQDVGLLDGAGETIQEETLGGVGLGQTGLNHAGGDIGGHQLAGINVLLGLDAERGALADVGAEQISGGDV